MIKKSKTSLGVLLLICIFLLAGAGISGAEMARYDVDPDHSSIEFSVVHMVVSKTKGRFTDYKGFVEMDPDGLKIKAIEAVINTASVNTMHEKRDGHLKNEDFFNVEKYPTMTYKMKYSRKEGDNIIAIGDLTMLGVTREVTLTGKFNGLAKDPYGNTRAGFTAEGKLNRKDFGMNWSKLLDSGGMVVGDDITLKLEIECIKATPAK
ncbi:MAG TPA: YceI family protein [Nitrospirota bacterium]|nr:YceI family protein [Nitrospirota bacterium]